MQPRPRLVTKRRIISSRMEPACAVRIMQTAKKKVEAMRTGRRPILSASMLSSSEPMSSPAMPATKTEPNSALSTFQSCTMAGAT